MILPMLPFSRCVGRQGDGQGSSCGGEAYALLGKGIEIARKDILRGGLNRWSGC